MFMEILKTHPSKFSFFLLFSFFFLNLSSSIVNSQSTTPTDPCTSDDLNGLLNIPTTDFHCVPAWTAERFYLRYLQSDAADSNIWSFILSAPDTSSYIAMGFSSDGRMAGSSAIVGWVPGEGRPGIVKQYLLGSQDENRVNPDQGELQIVENSTVILSRSSRLYMAFQLNVSQPRPRLIYSVGPENWFPSSRFRLIQHRNQASTRLDYQSGQSKSQRPFSKLRKSHGIVNMLSWGILMLIGTMVARYFRKWDPLWYYTHASIQLIGFILGVSGVIMGLVLEDVLGAQVDRHKTLGIFVLVLGCLQVMAFLTRPLKESRVRIYWNWYHYIVGRVLIILSITNVFYGIKVGKESNGWNAGYAVALTILIVTAFVLEVRMWMRK